ncbi:hypothetical protein GCM10009716_40030 [Streptomyces sodiiphilus]|uniref:Uncharacterized protein n=1 Tax=Streptomyces sodiiphilus TaxID=226217 RepID=A0ABN2PPT1_9ACTN
MRREARLPKEEDTHGDGRGPEHLAEALSKRRTRTAVPPSDTPTDGRLLDSRQQVEGQAAAVATGRVSAAVST